MGPPLLVRASPSYRGRTGGAPHVCSPQKGVRPRGIVLGDAPLGVGMGIPVRSVERSKRSPTGSCGGSERSDHVFSLGC